MQTTRHKLPKREHVFVMSLLYHGFRLTRRRQNLKKGRGYVIPATYREDATGVDFFVKMPRDLRLLPVQVTQRGIRMYKKHSDPSPEMLRVFIEKSEKRVARKRAWCKRYKVAFVLVRDYDGAATNTTIA